MKIGATRRIEFSGWRRTVKKKRENCVKEESHFIDGESYYVSKITKKITFLSFTIILRNPILFFVDSMLSNQIRVFNQNRKRSSKFELCYIKQILKQ